MSQKYDYKRVSAAAGQKAVTTTRTKPTTTTNKAFGSVKTTTIKTKEKTVTTKGYITAPAKTTMVAAVEQSRSSSSTSTRTMGRTDTRSRSRPRVQAEDLSGLASNDRTDKSYRGYQISRYASARDSDPWSALNRTDERSFAREMAEFDRLFDDAF